MKRTNTQKKPINMDAITSRLNQQDMIQRVTPTAATSAKNLIGQHNDSNNIRSK